MGSNAHFTVLSNWKDRVFSPFLNCALVMPIASSTVSACTVNAILQLTLAGYITTYFGMTAISLQNGVYLPVHCYPCSQAKRIRVCIVKNWRDMSRCYPLVLYSRQLQSGPSDEGGKYGVVGVWNRHIQLTFFGSCMG